MEKRLSDETTSCEGIQRQFPALLTGTLDAEARGRVRGHLLSCKACTLAFGDVVSESMTPELTAKFQRPMPRPPAPVLEAIGVQHPTLGILWLNLHALATAQELWAKEERDRVCRALQSVLMRWARTQMERRLRGLGSRGMRSSAGADQDWPEQRDVSIVNSAGQPQGRTVHFQEVEPPTVTQDGEFHLTLHTEESGFLGWTLLCTVETEEGVRVTFTGELQPEEGKPGLQVRIKADGLPASAGAVVIPEECVTLSLQERKS